MGTYSSDRSELRDRLRHRAPHSPTKPPARLQAAIDQRMGRATLFELKPAIGLDYWRDGGYPSNFLPHAYATMGVTDPSRVLHMFSGGVRAGITVDVRIECKPMVVADAIRTPFADGTFDWIMADPPYAQSYATHLYGTGDKYPRPSHILREASRLLRPGGRLGVLHFIVPKARHGLSQEGVWGVYIGPDFAIRAWTVYAKKQPELIGQKEQDVEIGKDREGQEQRPDVKVIPPKQRPAEAPETKPIPQPVTAPEREKVGV
jgi:SAM-dependent methyltransferase